MNRAGHSGKSERKGINLVYKLNQCSTEQVAIARPISYELILMLMKAEVIQDWPTDLLTELDTGEGPEVDFPFWTPHATLVSERVAEYIKQNDLGDAQFLPIACRLSCGKASKIKYTVVNWLSEVDCLSLEHSETTESNGKLLPMRPVLDSSRVPQNVQVFRAKHDPVNVYASEDCVENMRTMNFTGWGAKTAPMV